jgi:hypothetical protein
MPLEEGRFIPQAVLRSMRRRARQDPNAPIRRLLGGWRNLVVIIIALRLASSDVAKRRGFEPAKGERSLRGIFEMRSTLSIWIGAIPSIASLRRDRSGRA